MRKILIKTASAIALSGFLSEAVAAPINPGGLADATKRIAPTRIARICREICGEGFCRRECFYPDTYGYDVYEPENDGYVVERRRVYREAVPPVYYEPENDGYVVERRRVYREAVPPVYHERRYGPGIRLHDLK